LADHLNHVSARIPLSPQLIARATGADPAVVGRWLERTAAPIGGKANHLVELMAVVEAMEMSVKPERIPEWLLSSVDALDGDAPADVIAAGGYQRVIDIAQWLSCGGFT
jgi:hypothetical protein